MPNISGTVGAMTFPANGAAPASGAFFKSNWGSYITMMSGEENQWSGEVINFNASRSSNIYSNSTTVQPLSIRILYIVKF